MATPASPFQDHAVPVLQNAAGIDDSDRADLHDIFHGSKDPAELAQKLQTLAVPDQVKSDLFEAKKRSIPPTPAVPKTVAAISSMALINPKILELAEQHPNVLKAITAAAAKESESEADKAAETASAESEGKQAAGDSEAPTLAPDVPATPSGHALVLASDGGLHHIPAKNIDRAKGIDPELKILHVEP